MSVEADQLAALSTQAITAVLLAARLAPLAWLAPWALSHDSARSTRLSLIVVLTLCLLPSASTVAASLPSNLPALLLLALRESLLGSVNALALALPLLALEWGGTLQGLATRLPGAAHTCAALQLGLGVAAFFALGGHRIALHLLSDNLASHPLGQLDRGPQLAALAAGSIELVREAFNLSLQLALPLAAALGLAEFGLALVARSAGVAWVPAAFAPGRGLLAIAVLFLISRALLGSLPELFRHMLGVAAQLFARM